MMSIEGEGQGWISNAVGSMGVALTALATWVWKNTNRRIAIVERKLDDKASNEEMNRQRDNIAELFRKLSDQSERTEIRFTVMEAKNNDRHVELLKAIHSIKEKT